MAALHEILDTYRSNAKSEREKGWENCANDIAKITRTHIARITAVIEDPAATREVALDFI